MLSVHWKALGFAALTVAILLTLPLPCNSLSTAIMGAISSRNDAYSKLRAAEADGANVTNLVARFNIALGFLTRAENLDDSGNHIESTSISLQAQIMFQSISSDARALQNQAQSRRQLENRERLINVPILALLLTMIVFIGVSFRRTIKTKQFGEKRFKVVER